MITTCMCSLPVDELGYCRRCGYPLPAEPISPSVSAFIEWNRGVDTAAVRAVHKMFPDDITFKTIWLCSNGSPKASYALDHLRFLHADRLIDDADYYVAFHILQHVLVG